MEKIDQSILSLGNDGDGTNKINLSKLS